MSHFLMPHPTSYCTFSTFRGQACSSRTPNLAHNVRGKPQQAQYQYIEPGCYVNRATSYISPYAPPTPEQCELITTCKIRSQQPVSPTRSTGSRGLYSPPSSISPTTISSYTSTSHSRSEYNSRGMSGTSGRLSSTETASLIQSLTTHRVNTLPDLRHIEKTLLQSPTSDTTTHLTNAWAYYVNSNSLLNELRNLTQSYPFSSECIDEAKWKVMGDAMSVRSWNLCWLVLRKISDERLITKHARLLASKPAMWGGRRPSEAEIQQLAALCTGEWTRAVERMLRHWDTPPIVGGR